MGSQEMDYLAEYLTPLKNICCVYIYFTYISKIHTYTYIYVWFFMYIPGLGSQAKVSARYTIYIKYMYNI